MEKTSSPCINVSAFHKKVNDEAKEIAEWLVNLECGSGIWAIALRHALTNILENEKLPYARRNAAKHIRRKLFYEGMDN